MLLILYQATSCFKRHKQGEKCTQSVVDSKCYWSPEMRGNLWLALMAGNTSRRTEKLERRGEDIPGGRKMISVNKGKREAG